jgi:hypothetical protein
MELITFLTIDDRIEEFALWLEEHVRRKLEIARPGYDNGSSPVRWVPARPASLFS